MPEAHLDDLINEDSAVTAELLEEQERARAAELAKAPIRAVGASRAKVGAAAAGMARGAGSAVVAAGAAVGSSVGTVRRRAAERRAAASATRRTSGRRPARRVGIAALAVLAVAGPAFGSPAPWASLVGASADATGQRTDGAGLPDDLFGPNALGPLPSTLPARGLTVPLGNSPLGTAANPSAAGLPVGSSDRSIPSTVLLAYQQAADRLAAQQPGCQLQWTLLAGIGKVESNHARGWNGNGGLTPAGDASPVILGPVLDGSLAGTARLADTDGGRLDGNAQFDRAVGPMQFVPATWALLGADGNGDGVKNPNNIWDAALAAGGFLCEGGRDLALPVDQAKAVFAYNPSSEYVRTVLAWALAYGTGAEVDLNLPVDAFALPPEVSGAIDGFSVPLDGGAAFPYADSEGSPDVGFVPPSGGFSVPLADGEGQSQPVPQSPGTRPTPPRGSTPGGPTTNPPAPQPNPPAQPEQPPKPPPSDPPPSNPPPSNPPPTTAPEKFALTVTDLSATRSPSRPSTQNPSTSVRVVAEVDADAAGHSRLVLSVAGKDGHRVTGLVKSNQAFAKGPNEVVFELDGGFFGDAGVDGPFTVSLTQRETDAKGNPTAKSATPLGEDTTVGGDWTADEFANYVPTLQRIRDRVDEFADPTRDGLSTEARETLVGDLRGSGNLPEFRADLRSLRGNGVSNEAFTRLDSLAQRRIDAGSAAPDDPSSPAEPGWDPVYGKPQGR